MKWLSSSGGPLIFASASIAMTWQGSKGGGDAHFSTDCDLACAATEYLEVARRAGQDILILGDEPLQTTLLRDESSLVLARWVSCISKDLADQALSQIPQVLPAVAPPVTFVVSESKLVLFDSAYEASHRKNWISAELLPGIYTATTRKYELAEKFEFLIHQLIQSKSSSTSH